MTHIPVSDAKAQLTALVRRAEAGESIILTRNGKDVARITPTQTPRLTPEQRGEVIERAKAAVRGTIIDGPCAARSQDFLYDEDGLPA